jgi:uncharacterized protein YukE
MADSSMTNISVVESFGKNLENINQQMNQIFAKMKQQTHDVGNYWKDDMYEKFRQDFDQDILKHAQEISMKLELFSKYVERQCQFHRMAQQNKYY